MLEHRHEPPRAAAPSPSPSSAIAALATVAVGRSPRRRRSRRPAASPATVTRPASPPTPPTRSGCWCVWDDTADLRRLHGVPRARSRRRRRRRRRPSSASTRAELERAWSAADFEHQTRAAGGDVAARRAVPLAHVGAGPSASTAPGSVLFAYVQAGIACRSRAAPRSRAAAEVDPSDAEPGDLVYYPGHISMYLGFGDCIVHVATAAARTSRSASCSTARCASANPIGADATAGCAVGG